jgi:hypothetical protein
LIGLAVTFVILLAGGFALTAWVFGSGSAASCPKPVTGKQATGFTISGLPAGLTAPFGYNRGSRTMSGNFTVTPQKNSHRTPPRFIKADLVTLRTAEGVPLDVAVQLRARRVPGTHIYKLRACIPIPPHVSVAAGSYTGQIVFPGARISSGTGLRLTATFQDRSARWIFGLFGPLLVALGLSYTAAVLLRRGNPRIGLELLRQIPIELWSLNGLFAVIAAEGAVFTAWRAQCLDNATWGASRPDLIVTLVTLVGVAAAAATVPMSFASKPVKGMSHAGTG